MLSADEAKIRVARGAAHLDAHRPQWFNEIDVGTLTLRDPCGCIVGQLVGGSSYETFTHDAERIFPVTASVSMCSAVFFGADIGGGCWMFSELQDAWIAEIAARQCGQGDNEPAVPPEDGRGGLEETGAPVLTLRA